jgi:hypothetical protein
MKKALLLILVVSLFLSPVFSGPASVEAAGGLHVLGSEVEVDFPMKVNFSLAAASDTDITDIRLHYTVDRMRHAEVVSEIPVDFEPATRVDAGWSWDMRKSGGLPPGSSVGYWWTLEDASGEKTETEPAVVHVDDSRYPWRSLSEGLLTLYWYEGDEAFAQELMATAQQALVRLAGDTGAELSGPAAIYIYAKSEDLLGAMIFPQEWTGGVAYTRFSTIAIGISPGNLDWGKRAMTHELTHLVIHQMVFNPYNDLPTWLDEGLAMYAEGPLEPVFLSLLVEAIKEGRLITVRSLSSPFSAYAEESLLAYAQSYSLVDFLINNYGQSQMLELLSTFREGSGYDEALLRVYGFDMDGLNDLWLSYIVK